MHVILFLICFISLKATDACDTKDDSSGMPILNRPYLTSSNVHITPFGLTEDAREFTRSDQPDCPPNSGLPIQNRPYNKSVPFTVVPYGYVRLDVHYDTRKVINSDDEHVLFFPEAANFDIFCQDLNRIGALDMEAIDTRFGVLLIGPKWCDLTLEAIIEGDFRAVIMSPQANSHFRLRHAYGKILWEDGSFIFGQFWHPLFIVDCFANTIAPSNGIPFDPQAREPQFRLTQRFGDIELIGSLASQRDFQSNGPIGQTAEYIRNALVPNITGVVRYYYCGQLFGAAVDFLRLVPRTQTDTNIRTDESIDSITAEVFASLIYPPWSLRAKVIYSENGNDQRLISGFAVRTQDPISNVQTYTNTRAVSAWLDFSYIFHCDECELGFFAGYTKNLGAPDRIFFDPKTGQPIIFGLAGVSQDIDYVARFASRFAFDRDPIRFGFEVEWTRASYGMPDCHAKIINGIPVNNVRVLAALYYVF